MQRPVLQFVTLQTSQWHYGDTIRHILDICRQGALWSDAKHESVLWDHSDCSPAITALEFSPSTAKIEIANIHRHCSLFEISRLPLRNPPNSLNFDAGYGA